jgi:predicted transcriptional regulator
MSIHPRYAEAIVSGRKRAEFRKRSLAADVDVVLIYATAPVSAIIGWFTVRGTLKTKPEDIWRLLHDVGEICWSDFTAYYSGCHEGVALLVGEAGRLTKPVALAEIHPSPATPQSFNYLPGAVMTQIVTTPDPGERPALVCAASGSSEWGALSFPDRGSNRIFTGKDGISAGKTEALYPGV